MIVKANPTTKSPDAKATRFLDGLAAKYKHHFVQSTKSEATFLATEKQLKVAETKNLGLGRQSALARRQAGMVIAQVDKILGEISYRGGLKGWCAANDIAYSTARQARDLSTNLTEDKVRGLTITEALKLSGQIKDRAKERSAKAEAAKVLEPSNGHPPGNGKPTGAVSSSIPNDGQSSLPDNAQSDPIGPMKLSKSDSFAQLSDRADAPEMASTVFPEPVVSDPDHLQLIRTQVDRIEASQSALTEIEILIDLAVDFRDVVRSQQSHGRRYPRGISKETVK